jgi:hypothetical protein
MVNGKALGNPTTDSFDRANYAQAALTLTNGDPTLLRQYQGKFQEQDSLLVATYQQLQRNANPNEGIFGSNGAGVPAADRGFLKNLRREIDTNLHGIGGQSNKAPATGVINPSTQYDIQYLAGKMGNGYESQRLANLMSVLGPSRTYAVLANMTPAQAQRLGIQSSLNTLTDNLQLTAGDAKSLALAQANFATSQPHYDFPGNRTGRKFRQFAAERSKRNRRKGRLCPGMHYGCTTVGSTDRKRPRAGSEPTHCRPQRSV